jgi:acyl-CoA synthetase (AMP-forming)/AMP-acid ligase II
MNKLTQSYVHGASAMPLIGDTIGVHFDKAVARWPETEALVVRHQGVRWTYRDLQRHVDAFAAGLLAVLETVAAERCTALHGVPTMFIAELDHPECARFDLSSCQGAKERQPPLSCRPKRDQPCNDG